MSLDGEHIHRLITSSTEICIKAEEFMLVSILHASVTSDEDRDCINLFMGHMLELIAFDFLCAVMNRTMIQSEETIEKFGCAAKWFGVEYREYFSKDVIPKVNYLETHLIEDSIRHKFFGLYDESPIERAHHTDHVYNRLYDSSKSWFNRQETMKTEGKWAMFHMFMKPVEVLKTNRRAIWRLLPSKARQKRQPNIKK